MFIESIQPLQSLNELGKSKERTDGPGDKDLFKSIFKDAVNNYVDSEKQVDEDIYRLSVGETDDLHNLVINMRKAEMSLDLMLQLRSKALDAYNEIMRMGV